MRFIKLAIISFVFLFLLVTLLSLLIPSHIRISKAINIGAPRDSIFQYIKDSAQWKEWHPAFKKAPAQSQSVHIQTISSSDSVLLIKAGNRSKRSGLNGFQIYSHQQSDSLTLQWYMDFQLKWYPWQKFSSLFYEPTYGTMMQEGLEQLKILSEKTGAIR